MDFNKATLKVIRDKMQEALNDVSIEGLTIMMSIVRRSRSTSRKRVELQKRSEIWSRWLPFII